MINILISKNIAEINVLKLKNNVSSIKKRLDSKVQLCAVVKADAYGHGAPGVSSRIENLVDCFAVSHVNEGVELRLSGITKPIIVLLPLDYNDCLRAILYDLTVTVEGFESLNVVNLVSNHLKRSINCHLKVDTGMHRFGFCIDDLPTILNSINKRINVTGCFSHLHNPADVVSAEKQYNLFLKSKEIISSKFNNVTFHLSSSGGFLLGKKFHFDMVRIGLLLYGYKPFESRYVEVEPILKVKTRILKSSFIPAKSNLLYGDFQSEKGIGIDIIATGYSDGFYRSDVQIINNRCMDVSAVHQCNKKYYTVFDNAYDAARQHLTIPYEILCNVTKRAQIVYEE